MTKHEEFLIKILATFKIEAKECIQNMTSNIIELEKNPSSEQKTKLIEATYREVHSLKGASRAVNIEEIETICQALENLYAAIKDDKLALTQTSFDAFHSAINILTEILETPRDVVNEALNNKILDITDMLDEIVDGKTNRSSSDLNKKAIKAIRRKNTEQKSKEIKTNVKLNPEANNETIRVSADKLDRLLYQVEEMLSLKLNAQQRIKDVKSIIKNVSTWKKEYLRLYKNTSKLYHNLKTNTEHANSDNKSMLDILNFLQWSHPLYKSVEGELEDLRIQSVEDTHQTNLMVEKLLDDIKQIVSIPFSSILDTFPKVVRDLSSDQDKKVNFSVTGSKIEIDKRILEELKNPLMHLLRNCIDHGIEKPNERTIKNKPPTGTIKFSIKHIENNKVELNISDDGMGIDLDKLKTFLINNEKISIKELESINELQLLSYIFKSGISTCEMITDISGRGLGLAIVKEKIEQLGGTIMVKTAKNKGTEFIIQLPLSIVIFRAVLINISHNQFVIPTSNIERVFRVDKNSIKQIKGKPAINYNGGLIPLISLSHILKLPNTESNQNYNLVIVLGNKGNETAFIVNEILYEEEVLVKNLNTHIKRLKYISGAAVLGSGKVIPILHVSDLIFASQNSSPVTVPSAIKKEKRKKTILVAEDSITSRILLKTILETAGYHVTIAIDGMEAFSRLKEKEYDLILSDINMPKMNGFELTSKIRDDQKLKDKPVILVTSLSNKKDRERGLQAGANAYVVKSSFNEGNLLEIIEKLI